MMGIPGSGSLIILVWFFLSACLISCFNLVLLTGKLSFVSFIFFSFYNWDVILCTRFSFFCYNFINRKIILLNNVISR